MRPIADVTRMSVCWVYKWAVQKKGEPINIFSGADSCRHTNHVFDPLDPQESAFQTASRSVHPYLHSSPYTQHTQTDTQTTLRATSIAVGRICVQAMLPTIRRTPIVCTCLPSESQGDGRSIWSDVDGGLLWRMPI